MARFDGDKGGKSEEGASRTPTLGSTLRFAFNPELGRLGRPLAEAAGLFVLLIAAVFVSVRLIDRTHPAATGQVRGLRGLARVVTDAALGLKFTREGLPQVVLFYAVTGALLLMAIAIFGTFLQLALGIGAANALPSLPADQTLFEADDKPVQWLGDIFRMSSGAGSGAADGIAKALGPMLALYSYGALILAAMIAGYSVIAIVTETAHHGAVFGKRHSEVWAPIRFLFAIAILVPLPNTNGFNTGQVVVVKVAEWGSGLASNVWRGFVTALINNQDFVSDPAVSGKLVDQLRNLVEAEACAASYNITQAAALGREPGQLGPDERAVVLTRETPLRDLGWMMTDSMGFTQDRGRYDVQHFARRTTPGGPLSTDASAGCGKIKFYGPGGSNSSATREAIIRAQKEAFNNEAWRSIARQIGFEIAAANNPATRAQNQAGRLPDASSWAQMLQIWKTSINTSLNQAMRGFRAEALAQAERRINEYGWISASFWYFEVARMNGGVLQVAQAVPDVLTRAGDQNMVEGAIASGSNWVRRQFGAEDRAEIHAGAAMAAARTWTASAAQADGRNVIAAEQASDWVDYLLSKVDVRAAVEAFRANSADPMTTLVEFGNSLRIVSVAGFVAAAASGVNILGFSLGPTAGLIIFTISGAIYGAAVTLCVVLPLMPAMRMFFGIMSWLLAVFEAVVAVPVLALAHMRTDGDGFMGPMAQSGYLLLLQLFLRPVLMIFGLVCAYLLFNTTMGIVNEVYGAVVAGVNGTTLDALLNSVAHIVVYVSFAYALANMCFKAIDLVPDQVLRWIGSSGFQTLGDTEGVSNMSSRAASAEQGVVSRNSERFMRRPGA